MNNNIQNKYIFSVDLVDKFESPYVLFRVCLLQ